MIAPTGRKSRRDRRTGVSVTIARIARTVPIEDVARNGPAVRVLLVVVVVIGVPIAELAVTVLSADHVPIRAKQQTEIAAPSVEMDVVDATVSAAVAHLAAQNRDRCQSLHSNARQT